MRLGVGRRTPRQLRDDFSSERFLLALGCRQSVVNVQLIQTHHEVNMRMKTGLNREGRLAALGTLVAGIALCAITVHATVVACAVQKGPYPLGQSMKQPCGGDADCVGVSYTDAYGYPVTQWTGCGTYGSSSFFDCILLTEQLVKNTSYLKCINGYCTTAPGSWVTNTTVWLNTSDWQWDLGCIGG